MHKAYYIWARKQIKADVESGYSTLMNLRSPLTKHFLIIIKQLPEALRLPTWLSLQKRFHPQGCILAGESMTENDKEIIQRYDRQRHSLIATLAPDIVPDHLISKAVLKREVVRMFQETFQVRAENLPSRQIRFVTQHKHCILHTYLETMSTKCQFSYHHKVHSQSGKILREPCSILESFGLASQTYWYDISENDLDGILQTLSGVVRNFVDFCESECLDELP